MTAAVWALLRKDLLLEWRQKHALFGIALYAASAVFMIYMMTGLPEARVWNALFWITQLFTGINAVAKSFLQEPPQRFRYYYTVASPAAFLLSKILYAILIQAAAALLSLALFRIMLGNPIVQSGVFVGVAISGAVSIAVVFTFLSAIAARTGGNAALMAVLGFPLITPVLLMLSRLSLQAVALVYQSGWWQLAATLLLLDVLVVVLGLILFPFVWQE